MRDEFKVKKIKSKLDEIYNLINDVNLDDYTKQTLEDTFKEIDYIYEDFIKNYLDFKEISDHLYDGIYISDGTGKTLFVNEAYSRFTEIKKEEVIGRNVRDISKEGKLYKGAVTMEVIKRKAMVNSLGRSLVNQKDLLVTGSPIFDENNNVKLVVINNRDISDLKKLELANAKLEDDRNRAHQEIEFLRRQQTSKANIVRDGKYMKATLDLISTIAPTDVTVLIMGESGTGKEVIVDEIYSNSLRMDKPLIKVNCAAIPSELLESELFGYEGGSFTGAKKTGKIGLFELANGGTILLDEIGDMSLKLQSKLLRVLQSKEITRIGGSNQIKLDIRVIASTNKDLKEEVENGKFRGDLYYRLNVVPIKLKPLRERKDEILSLTYEFLNRYNKKYNKNVKIESSAKKLLLLYNWPGNIRELENIIERTVVINKDGIIRSDSLYSLLGIGELSNIKKIRTENFTLKEEVQRLETEIIKEAIYEMGSINRASSILGLSQPALSKKCKLLNIDVNKIKVRS